jgi:hypothetical protein
VVALTVAMLKSTDFGVGFLPLLGKQGGKFLQQDFGFFAEESIR